MKFLWCMRCKMMRWMNPCVKDRKLKGYRCTGCGLEADR